MITTPISSESEDHNRSPSRRSSEGIHSSSSFSSTSSNSQQSPSGTIMPATTSSHSSSLSVVSAAAAAAAAAVYGMTGTGATDSRSSLISSATSSPTAVGAGATYPRLTGFYPPTGYADPTSVPACNYMSAFTSASANPSSFYPSLSHPYTDLKEGNGCVVGGGHNNSWTSSAISQASAACYPYTTDHSLYNPYGDRYVTSMDSAARRKNATRETTNTLKAWLYEHRKNPYPTKGEKIMLAIITKMTLTQVSTWFANARRRLKKENKMTWEPRNKTNDGHDSDDKESIAGGSEDGSSCDHVQHGNGCSTGRTTTLISMNNGTSGHSNNNNSSSSNDRHRNHRSDTHVTPSVVAGTVSAVSPVTHPHYPIVKSEGLTTITDLSCTDKRSAALLTHHSIPGTRLDPLRPNDQSVQGPAHHLQYLHPPPQQQQTHHQQSHHHHHPDSYSLHENSDAAAISRKGLRTSSSSGGGSSPTSATAAPTIVPSTGVPSALPSSPISSSSPPSSLSSSSEGRGLHSLHPIPVPPPPPHHPSHAGNHPHPHHPALHPHQAYHFQSSAHHHHQHHHHSHHELQLASNHYHHSTHHLFQQHLQHSASLANNNNNNNNNNTLTRPKIWSLAHVATSDQRSAAAAAAAAGSTFPHAATPSPQDWYLTTAGTLLHHHSSC